MPAQTIERALTAAEREILQQYLDDLPSRIVAAVQHALRIFSASVLALLMLWVVLLWPAGAIFHAEIGPASGAAPGILALLVAAGAVWAICSALRRLRSGRDSRSLLEADIAGGKAVEERCRFVAAKRFQEQKHGGLIYFLRADDDGVLVLYDHESQHLGASGGDPLSSPFRPRAEYVIRRAPHCGYAMTQEFSGAALDAGKPVALLVLPEKWPEPEAWCDVPWDELERHFSDPDRQHT